MALGTGVGIIWHRQPGFGGVESCTASGSTVDDLGATSRLHVTVTLCEEPNFFPAESLDSGMTLTVNGDDTSWVLANGSADGNSITWDVETVGGNPNPISNGDVVVVDFDGSWIYPGEALQITLTNLIPAPVELLTLPAFDATTGRLDLGDFYNTRTTAETFVNSDGYVESVPANRMVYDGARVVQNLLSLYTTPISSEDFSGWGGSSEFIYTSGITDPENGNTAIRIEARHNNAAHFISIPYTNSDDRNFLNTYWLRRISGTGNVYLYTANGGWKDITTTLSTAWQRISSGSFTGYAGEVRVGLALGTSGDVIDVSFIQSEDTTAKADQDLPGEYESVGVGTGDELCGDPDFDDTGSWWTEVGSVAISGGVCTYTGAGSALSGSTGIKNQNLILELDIQAVGTVATVVISSPIYSPLTTFTPSIGTNRIIFNPGNYDAFNIQISPGTGLILNSASIKKASTGYGIYNRANGNTVDVNGVVTDTPGAVLATAPVLRHAPAATNLIYPSTPNSTDWIFRGTVTGTNVEEGHALGPTCQIRGLGDIYVDDIYKNFTALSSGNRFEPSLHIKAVSTSGILKLWHPRGGAYGDWSIAMASLSTSAFEHITRDHASVTITTEFTTHPDNQVGLLLYTASGTLDFDILGCQTEEGTVSTPTIKTTTAPVSRAIDQILHRRHGRIGEARVDVARLLAGKSCGRLGGGFEHETRGQEYRLAVLVELAALGTRAHRQRILVVSLHSREMGRRRAGQCSCSEDTRFRSSWPPPSPSWSSMSAGTLLRLLATPDRYSAVMSPVT